MVMFEIFIYLKLGEKWGGTPILSHPLAIFTSVLTFLGGKKCPKSGLVSLKKYIVFFITLAGGKVQTGFNNCYIFFKASLKGDNFKFLLLQFLQLVIYQYS